MRDFQLIYAVQDVEDSEPSSATRETGFLRRTAALFNRAENEQLRVQYEVCAQNDFIVCSSNDRAITVVDTFR